MRWFVIKFFVLAIAIFTLHYQKDVYAAVTQPWTELLAQISAAIVHVFDADVISKGVEILTTRPNAENFSGVQIVAGCNGIEACLVLFAAILAFPAPWGYRLKGIILGFFAIQSLNVVRVISLFYLGQWSHKVFEFAHLYAWQVLIILDAVVVFLVWLAKLPSDAGFDDFDDTETSSDEMGDDSDLLDVVSEAIEP